MNPISIVDTAIRDGQLSLWALGMKTGAMLAAGAPKEYAGADQSLIKLLGELAKRTDCRQIFIQKKGLTLRLEKHTPWLRSAES